MKFAFLRRNNIDLYLTTLILLGIALGTLLPRIVFPVRRAQISCTT